MTFESQLRDAVPARTTATLDHADLQRRGRRRRWTRRAMAGLGGVSGIVAVGVLVVPPGNVTVDVAASPGDSDVAGEHVPNAPDAPDPAVVAGWEGLSHADAVARLHASLDEHPARPDGLDQVTVYGFPSAGQVSILRADTPGLAVVDVSDDAFVVGETVDPVALLPAWNQEGARSTLDTLGAGASLRYAGIVVDPDGRTVVAFEANDGHTQLWIDPESGYTVGAHLGEASNATPAPVPPVGHSDQAVPEPADP